MNNPPIAESCRDKRGNPSLQAIEKDIEDQERDIMAMLKEVTA